MPEGSEVRVITDHVKRKLEGRVITQIKIVGGRFVDNPPFGFDEFEKTVNTKGVLVKSVDCHGKFMYWTLDNDWSVWISLGMTGGFTCNKKAPHAALRWSHVHPHYDARASTRLLFFADQRRFGTVKFVQDPVALQDKLDKLGVDLLADDPGWEKIHVNLTRKPQQEITQALMDQKRFAGVGNYVKADALYRAGISPRRLCGAITEDDSRRLYDAIRLIFKDSYEVGSNGEYYQKVCYSQKADPDGNPIIKEQTADKRKTWWCPTIQS